MIGRDHGKHLTNLSTRKSTSTRNETKRNENENETKTKTKTKAKAKTKTIAGEATYEEVLHAPLACSPAFVFDFVFDFVLV